MVSTFRLYYDASVAVALMAVAALVCGLIAGVVTGGSSPNLPVGAIAFLVTGGIMFFRIRRTLCAPRDDNRTILHLPRGATDACALTRKKDEPLPPAAPPDRWQFWMQTGRLLAQVPILRRRLLFMARAVNGDV